MDSSDVNVILLSYNDRILTYKQVLEALLKINYLHINIVFNGTNKKVIEYMNKLQLHFSKKITTHYLDKNYGVPYAYGYGMRLLNQPNNRDFIWLLDDDNLIDEVSLFHLCQSWNSLHSKLNSNRFVLTSFRSSRNDHKTALDDSNLISLGSNNSFYFFCIDYIVHKFKIFSQNKERKHKNSNSSRYIRVPNTPYGGLFFHKSLLNTIGYPNKNYFLYGDDGEFTYRFTKNNIPIYIDTNSKLVDIDPPNLLSQTILDPSQNNTSHFRKRLYFLIRNRIIFERENLVNSTPKYILNMTLFSMLFCNFFVIQFKFKNIKTYFKALRDGWFKIYNNNFINVNMR